LSKLVGVGINKKTYLYTSPKKNLLTKTLNKANRFLVIASSITKRKTKVNAR
jgi:hypothetical protein